MLLKLGFVIMVLVFLNEVHLVTPQDVTSNTAEIPTTTTKAGSGITNATSTKPAGEAGSTKPAGEAGSAKPTAEAGSAKPAAEAGSAKPTAQAGSAKPAAQAGSAKPTAQAGSTKPAGEQSTSAGSSITKTTNTGTVQHGSGMAIMLPFLTVTSLTMFIPWL